MRRALLPLISALALVFSANLHAQYDRFAYAITDLTKDGSGWNALRRLDLQTGAYSEVLLNGTDLKTTVYDAASHKQLVQQNDARFGTLLQAPFSTGVAAAAYDRKNKRLYYTPMFIDQLRYIDLKTMKVYYVTGEAFTQFGNMQNDEAKIVTRMAITPDGTGYAITNDGNSMIRFSTGKKIKIEQMGPLVDDASNKGISIHNRCSSFGGDMVSDDRGDLFILSARNHVFKVNTQTKVATHLGSISGLSPNFTVNGAVVDGNGDLLVSSAVDGNTYFVVSPKDWSAKPYPASGGIFRSSDLANSNFLTSKSNGYTEKEIRKMIEPKDKFAKLISIYPNPVTTSQITIQFNNIPPGNYMMELRDILGRSLMQRKIAVRASTETQTFDLAQNNAKGIYMVKVFDADNSSVFSQKLVVQ
ncbi:MAG: T9SS type A sorting domain-containing protein [Flavisolibacter sp.]